MSRRRARWRARRQGAATESACCLGEAAICASFSLGTFGTLATVAAGYRAVPPVVEGRRTTRPLLRAIRSYQVGVSAHRPAVCNLEPTCSAYGYAVLYNEGVGGLRHLWQRLRACAEAGRRNRVR